ncbi:PucR family transcriptional regulator [Pseudonocardia alni]|uniref:PucR family transcriptional regulator n=1 Tax=Pseudonocardia alni TaxID=33907 RepID=UPI00280C310D|nr:helix-turn-helix domain-containing protein [Pseudonocardia alni]
MPNTSRMSERNMGGSRHDLEAVVDDLAEGMGRSVVVNDPAVRVLYTSRHFDDADDLRIRAVLQHDAGAEAGAYVLGQGVARWSSPGTIPANAALGMHARFCVPLRERGELLGLLMVMDADGTLTTAEADRIEETSRTVAALLARGRAEQSDENAAQEAGLRALLDTDPAIRREAPRTVEEGPALVVVVDVAPATGRAVEAESVLRGVLGSSVRRLPGRAAAAADGRRGILLQVGPHLAAADGRREAERIVAAVDLLLPAGDGAVAGIGDLVSGTAEAWLSHEHAVVAARGARLLAERGPVVDWAGLGAHGLLLGLGGAVRADLLPEPLRRLRADKRSDRLIETLRAYLDAGGSVPRTAAALRMHRTSLHYRLDQLREITGLDLDDGADRLLLHLGLVLSDLLPPAP